jgi:hypothetical protein
VKDDTLRRIVTHTSHTADDQFGGPKFRAVSSVCQKLNKGSGLPPNWGFICDRDREGVEGKRKEEADGGAEGATGWRCRGPHLRGVVYVKGFLNGTPSLSLSLRA